jgi:ABC-type glycerol-3-phosphate transport system substrate-binding protein
MRMVKVIITVSVCILMVLTLFGCNSENDNNNNSDLLTIYVVNESPIIRLIDAYNDSNKSDKINVVEIQDGDTLNSKLSAELMAGKGPDIVLYDSSYNGISNMEKMMALDVFADYNELIKNDSSDSSIDLKNYNEVVMDSGIYNGKRYFMPISYMPNFLITTTKLSDEYSIDTSKSITYEKSPKVLSKYLNKAKKSENMSGFYNVNEELYALIDSNIDFFNKTNTLQSDKFLNNLNALSELILPADKNNSLGTDPLELVLKGNTMFASLYQITGSEPNGMGYIYYYFKSNSQTPLIMNNLSDSEDTSSAFIDKGFLINNNSDKKESAFKFVKYMLSEDVQCNSEVGLPVNKAAQKKLIEEIDLDSYNMEKDSDYNNFISNYSNALDGINKCGFRNDYFNNSIINDVVSKYVSGDITEKQFIKEIQGKTQLYLNE